MDLIDTHCHLYVKEFDSDRSETLQKAGSEGVKFFFLPSIDAAIFPALLEMEKDYPDKCFAMAGLHPCSVKQDYRQELSFFEDALKQRKFAAVGEIGLDFYWDRSFEADQYTAFREQIGWALHYDIPIVIHSREAMTETIRVVREMQNGRLRGIFHCFSDSLDSARQIVDLGFYLGIGGVLTYKKSALPEVVAAIGLEHMVLETDSPYLPPVPFRGKRNEPAYLPFIVQKLAEVKGISADEVAETTTRNARNIFGH